MLHTRLPSCVVVGFRPVSHTHTPPLPRLECTGQLASTHFPSRFITFPSGHFPGVGGGVGVGCFFRYKIHAPTPAAASMMTIIIIAMTDMLLSDSRKSPVRSAQDFASTA